MMKKLDIAYEREMLSTAGKRTWDKVEKEIDKVAKEMKLDSATKEALKQRKMAAIRYADLDAKNKYNERTNDSYAKNNIVRNKLEMQRMDAIYNDNYQVVKNVEPELNRRIEQLQVQNNKSVKKSA